MRSLQGLTSPGGPAEVKTPAASAGGAGVNPILGREDPWA